MEQQYWALSNINLYNILCPIKIGKYDKDASHYYAKDDVIYAKNKVDYNIYMVNRGKVKLVNYDDKGREIVKQILVKGALFGEKILLDESKRNEYAVASEHKTTVCKMNLSAMKKLMRENESFATKIYRFIGLRLKKTERRLELLIGKDVSLRVACFIYDLHIEHQQPTFSHQFSQRDIASLLATSRESVAKAFNKMKFENVIDYNRREIVVKNAEKLLELSKD